MTVQLYIVSILAYLMYIEGKYKELGEFLDSVFVRSHSNSTISSYKLSIVNKKHTGFRDFLKENYSWDELQLVYRIKNENLDFYKILNEFVVFLDKKGYKPKSIELRLTATKGYLRHLGIRIYSEDFKHNVRLPKIQHQREEPLTKEMISRVLRNVSPKLQTVILVLTASGMRIGELVQLTLDDIDFSEKPTRIKIRAEITKNNEARETFLTEEATKSLKDYLKRYFGWNEDKENFYPKNMTVFGRTSLSSGKKKLRDETSLKLPSSYTAGNLLIKGLASAIRKIPELNEKNSNGRKIIHYHALRKYFRTVMGNVAGRDYSEALMGRHFYLDTYYNMPAEDRRQKYLEAEPHLTISDFKTVERNFTKLSQKHELLENKVDGMLEYFKTQGVKVPESLLP